MNLALIYIGIKFSEKKRKLELGGNNCLKKNKEKRKIAANYLYTEF